jgi:hypothetical protein
MIMNTSSTEKMSLIQNLLKVQNLVYLGIAWSVISLLFFLLFSVNAEGEESPLWYLVGTYVFETLPFLGATLLCYRNWQSPQIASGRNVWFGIGIGLLCFSVGNLVFGWWELGWGLEPDVSPADLFYIAFYIAVIWGMFLAVLPRRLNLETWQWTVVAIIGALGTTLAVILSFLTRDNVKVPPELPEDVPGWVIGIETVFSQFAGPVNLFYIVGDVILLIIATTLLLAFWGGRFSQSWRMIAGATFALYIADMGFKYVSALPGEYESGGVLDIFFVFSGVLFAIGAALEYDVSSRPTRSRRKRG